MLRDLPVPGALPTIAALVVSSGACVDIAESPASPGGADAASVSVEEGMILTALVPTQPPDAQPRGDMTALSSAGLVLPPRFGSTLGNGNDFMPFSNPRVRYQQAFLASEVGDTPLDVEFTR